MKSIQYYKGVLAALLLISLTISTACSNSGDAIMTTEINTAQTGEETETQTEELSVSEESNDSGEADSVYGNGDMENTFFENNQTENDYNSPEWLTRLAASIDENVSQLFVVGGMGMDLTTATVSMHEKGDDGNWKQLISTPGFVGKNGLCKDEDRVEGCGQTPIGVYRFNKAFGIADDPGCQMDYIKVDDNLYWSGDDREGMHYNEMVDIREIPNLDMTNSEHIIDYDYQYQYCLNISFNENGEAGRGSAIFLHCFGSKDPYTGGCVAIPENMMKLVMQNVREDCVVVIDTMDNLGAGASVASKASDTSKEAAGKSSDPSDASGFVLLSEAVPDAILEIRYYSTYNFVGDKIDGYEEPVALLTKEAAAALKEVSDELKGKGYRLKIYDAYRPQGAVDDFVNWAGDKDERMKEYFYPEIEKSSLFSGGYIASRSGHSRGSTVDLTLFDMSTEKEVDMGGTFDYFGEESHPGYKNITEEQYNNRMILRDAMVNHGFNPIDTEWWHFTLSNEPYPDTYFTFPVNSDSLKQ